MIEFYHVFNMKTEVLYKPGVFIFWSFGSLDFLEPASSEHSFSPINSTTDKRTRVIKMWWLWLIGFILSWFIIPTLIFIINCTAIRKNDDFDITWWTLWPFIFWFITIPYLAVVSLKSGYRYLIDTLKYSRRYSKVSPEGMAQKYCNISLSLSELESHIIVQSYFKDFLCTLPEDKGDQFKIEIANNSYSSSLLRFIGLHEDRIPKIREEFEESQRRAEQEKIAKKTKAEEESAALDKFAKISKPPDDI